MRTPVSQHNLNHVYAIGISFLFAATTLGLTTSYLIWIYVSKNYLEVKPMVAQPQADPNRKGIETKHRELLQKAGFKYQENEVNLASIPTENLKVENQKIEKALRSGK